MTVAPNLTGFQGAMERLRQQTGVDCVFTTPDEPTYPPDVAIDPDTGRPYDPFATPTVPAVPGTATVRCGFAHRVGGGADDAQPSPLGAIDAGSAALIIAEADYPTVKDATRVRVVDEVYDIEMFRQDVRFGHVRWIAFLEHA